MRPEGKSIDDNQMGMRSIGDSGSDVGTTAGVSLTSEDKSGLPVNGGVPNTPDSPGYSAPYNAKAVPINKSRGTGVQINNGALDAGQAAGGDGNASAYAKVTSIQGEKVAGMNSGPSIGRFDNPPPVITATGTPEAVDTAMKAVPQRWPGTDVEHRHPHPQDNDGTPTGLDRTWR